MNDFASSQNPILSPHSRRYCCSVRTSPKNLYASISGTIFNQQPDKFFWQGDGCRWGVELFGNSEQLLLYLLQRSQNQYFFIAINNHHELTAVLSQRLIQKMNTIFQMVQTITIIDVQALIGNAFTYSRHFSLYSSQIFCLMAIILVLVMLCSSSHFILDRF